MTVIPIYPVVGLTEMLEAIWKFVLPALMRGVTEPLALIVWVPADEAGTVKVALHDPVASAVIPVLTRVVIIGYSNIIFAGGKTGTTY